MSKRCLRSDEAELVAICGIGGGDTRDSSVGEVGKFGVCGGVMSKGLLCITAAELSVDNISLDRANLARVRAMISGADILPFTPPAIVEKFDRSFPEVGLLESNRSVFLSGKVPRCGSHRRSSKDGILGSAWSLWSNDPVPMSLIRSTSWPARCGNSDLEAAPRTESSTTSSSTSVGGIILEL